MAFPTCGQSSGSVASKSLRSGLRSNSVAGAECCWVWVPWRVPQDWRVRRDRPGPLVEQPGLGLLNELGPRRGELGQVGIRKPENWAMRAFSRCVTGLISAAGSGVVVGWHRRPPSAVRSRSAQPRHPGPVRSKSLMSRASSVATPPLVKFVHLAALPAACSYLPKGIVEYPG